MAFQSLKEAKQKANEMVVASLFKRALDTLVKAKIMKDDSPKHAWPKSFPTQTKCKKTEVRLELTLDFQSDNLTK